MNTVSTGPQILVVAGWDSSRGAGVDADLETLEALGCAGHVVLTALTEQGAGGLKGAWPVPVEAVQRRIETALEVGGIGAVKVGMLATAQMVVAVAESLPADVPLVLDPVLATTSGGLLLEVAGVLALKEVLAPRAALLTPNLPELEALGGERWARELGVPVLCKGGHASGEVLRDRLWIPGQAERVFSHPRLPGSLRGSGCRLATAIAVGLARGLALAEAVEEGIVWLQTRFGTPPCGAGEALPS
jgi:hydroxymethylpyrimidine/phosphomethylpyrimidine kinase